MMIEKLSTAALLFWASRRNCKVFRVDGRSTFDGWDLKAGPIAEGLVLADISLNLTGSVGDAEKA